MAETIHIGEAARRAGVTVDTVRFYQRLGLVQVPARTVAGYRLFDETQIHNLKFVRHAQDLGFSLNEIRDLLALRQKPHACGEVRSILTHKLANVREKIRNLARLEAELAKALRNCERELRLNRAVQHEDCCPLLSKLEEENSANGKRGIPNRRRPGKS